MVIEQLLGGGLSEGIAGETTQKLCNLAGWPAGDGLVLHGHKGGEFL